MPKTFVLHDESLNSYGFWMRTSGADLTQFQKNPIMLWNHNRPWREEENQVLPIGHWENIRIEGDKILADAIFDNDPFSQKIAAKVESGTLRMASIGAKDIEQSEDPIYIKPGQRFATVLKFKVREASIVDIGSNDNALALYDELDKLIELSATGGSIPLKELVIHQNKKQMKEVAKLLKLAENATETDMVEAIRPIQNENVTLREDLQKEKDKSRELQERIDAIELKEKNDKKATFEKELELAFKDGRLTEKPEGDKQTPVRDNMVALFDANADSALAMLQGLTPRKSISAELRDTPAQNAFEKRKAEIEAKAAEKKKK